MLPGSLLSRVYPKHPGFSSLNKGRSKLTEDLRVGNCCFVHTPLGFLWLELCSLAARIFHLLGSFLPSLDGSSQGELEQGRDHLRADCGFHQHLCLSTVGPLQHLPLSKLFSALEGFVPDSNHTTCGVCGWGWAGAETLCPERPLLTSVLWQTQVCLVSIIRMALGRTLAP